MKILIADDDAGIREAFCTALTEAGYDVSSATNGAEAIDFLQKGEFAVLITDIVMPVKEGIETIAEARRLRGESLKILAISGGGRADIPSFLELAKKAGADDTMTRPIGPAQLLEKVKSLTA